MPIWGNETDRFSWRLGGDKDAAQEPCRIQHLTLDSTRGLEEEYQLALECQELRSLCWRSSFSRRFGGPPVPLDLDLARGRWPHLQRLCFPHNLWSDDHLAAVLRTLGAGHKLGKRAPLKELDATFTGFHTQCAQVLLDELAHVVPADSQSPSSDLIAAQRPPQEPLSRTGFALESLLLLASKCSGAYIQRFLCEVPTLKRFSGNTLADMDIALDPRPWVCHDLEELNLGFMRTFSTGANEPPPASHGFSAGPILNLATNSNTGVTTSTSATGPSATGSSLSKDSSSKRFRFPQTFILDRIAALTNMEELNMAARRSSENGELLHFVNAIDPNTEEPHEDWARFAQMKKLRITEWQDIDTREARWITQTWPTSLERVRALNHHYVSLEAKALLKCHGIKVIETQDLDI